MWGFGFRVSSIVFKVSALGFRVYGFRFGVSGVGCRVLGFGIWGLWFGFKF